ncbi:hypothetical protein ABS768_06395 [Flavobacterium sp. ST-75]|uniref:TonB C-terminal domain-containing protein n=2 Tax=Flavobacterium TaxID=237 RepID=A0A0A2LKR4_9FLAO|nr:MULTISPECIES: hypothetical protein [Flavobacterium]KGO79866.1 hypothetical protein Q763_11710 [Flavobacterium beibuense F44-8]MEE1897872.1 hypothetical protein [Flavobacterium rakeshii]
MKKAVVALSLLLLGSCQYFDKKVPSEEELLQKRRAEINMDEVSSYPSIGECDSVMDKEQKKECFFSSMTRLVQERLDADTLLLLYPEIDTIQLKVTIFPDATLAFETEFPKDSVGYDRTKIDSLLRSRLSDFPAVEPASKEGIPVKSQFILPVIINVE